MTVDAGTSLDERLAAYFASDPDAIGDSAALFGELRERAPLYRHPVAILVTGYDDVRELLREDVHLSKAKARGAPVISDALARMSEDERRAYAEVVAFEGLQLSSTDGEVHDRLRSIGHRAFTPARIRALEASVRRYADELIEPLLEQETADLMTVAYHLPLMVICDFLGIPQADRHLIRGWSDRIAENSGLVPIPERVVAARTAIAEFRVYVEGMLAGHRADPSTDLIAALVDAEEGDRLSEDELVAMFVLLLFAGHETTTNLIGIGMLELLRNRDQWELLAADPGLAAPATDELLRYVSPVQWQRRHVAADFEHGGLEIAAGDVLFLMLVGANRDPAVFEEPDRLDLRRDSRAHLALGFGPRFCLGASLTRLEGAIAFGALARRFPRMELATDSVRWRGSAHLRTLASLPVALG